MTPYRFTNQQARQFMLLKHGLAGAHKFAGKRGALDFVRQAGCIQYDPVDVCGKNAELTLQSRVKGFSKQMLGELLYDDRALLDYPDKNLSIIVAEDFPYFTRFREAGRNNLARYPEIEPLLGQAVSYIEANGPVSSDELKLDSANAVSWYSAIHWSTGSNPARAALEQLYTTGDLVIHHKKGTRKFYDLAKRHLPAKTLNSPEPLPDEAGHHKWRVLRRIGAVGLLWDKPSHAFLGVSGLEPAERNAAFAGLLEDGNIVGVEVEGVRGMMYARSEDSELIETVAGGVKPKPRCELIAPLDCMIWDRRLIKSIFKFDYGWEIYTPEANRKYGYYTLPLLYGDSFIGRVDSAANRKTKTLQVKNIWYENGVKQTAAVKNAVIGCLKRFASFNGCESLTGV